MSNATAALLALMVALAMPIKAETLTSTVEPDALNQMVAGDSSPSRTDGRGIALDDEAPVAVRMLELEARVAELEGVLADVRTQWRQRLLILEQRLAERPVVYMAADSTTTPTTESASSTPRAPLTSAAPELNTPNRDENAQQAFDAAIALILAENYPEAIRRLQALIENEADATVLPLVTYWLAEAHYAEESYRAALAVYEGFLARYPDDTNYGEALLKRGFSLMELERYDEAEAILNQVASEYAETNIAVLAARKLEFLYLIQGDSAASSATEAQ